MAELASRAVVALANAINKGDARSAMAVLRSLGVLRTYQPSKAPAGGAEKTVALPGMNFLAEALAESPKGDNEAEPVVNPSAGAPPTAGKEVRPAAANSRGTASKQEPTESRRTDCQAAAVLQYQNVTSKPVCGPKSSILAGKAGSAIKMACDSALQAVTECYQMLPTRAEQNASPLGASPALCA
jgi:hypothetical protein